jgi:acetyltransferase-like isoleucine patch superfamily enzyme
MIRILVRNMLSFFKYLMVTNIKIASNVALTRSILEGKNTVGKNTVFVNSFLGRGSYLSNECFFSNTKIGRYCSIGNRVKIVSATHPSNTFVSTHPAFFSLLKQAGFTYTKEQKFEEVRYLNKQEKSSVSIGNDVWIGDDVMILGGITIHDGAIIGSKALITRDVGPYTIVGGVPAKIIGQRFSIDEIRFLLDYKWWLKDEKWIANNAYLFSDIKKFIDVIQNKI